MQVKKIILVFFIILFLFGCAGKNINNISTSNLNNKGLLNCSGKIIGYAYMTNKGTKLLKVTTVEENIKNTETILIKKNGFCPDYDLPKGLEGKCRHDIHNKFCDSHYIVTSQTGNTILSNAVYIGILRGINLLGGIYFYQAKFDINKFNQVIRDNNLEAYQRKIIEIGNEMPLYYKKIKTITPQMLYLSARNIIDNEIPPSTRKSFYLKIIRKHPYMIKYIKHPDKDIQIAAIDSTNMDEFMNRDISKYIDNIHPDVVKYIKEAKRRVQIYKRQMAIKKQREEELSRKRQSELEKSKKCGTEVYTTCAPGIYPCRMVQTTRWICK